MNAQEFYDKMSADYHLISSAQAGPAEWQGEVIDQLLRGALRTGGPFRVLDCSCGVGTQSLGLARRGHQVLGTDISPRAVQRAEMERAKLGLTAKFAVADMRSLEGVEGPFDAVISFDNSLAHLTTTADLAFALSSVLSVLRPGGVFLASLRDYDEARKSRPSGTMPRHLADAMGERVYVQTWDWSEDGSHYDLRLFVLKRSGESWSANPLETRMRAYTRAEITEELEKTGFAAVEWVVPEVSRYYQPVFLARKA